jgi:FkbM family methyltransferase
MLSDLIYDVGAHNGDDTAFYLARGFRVVAIEADPLLADAARVRFAEWISSGRAEVLNVGVADREGEAEFWISHSNQEWNSFDPALAGRNNSPHHSVRIPVKPLRSVLADHGAPHYLKVDIEGYDALCLRDLCTLAPTDRPRFLSWENWDKPDHFDGSAQKTGSGLQIASDLGYTRFKLIDQSTLTALSRGFSASNLIDSIARRWLRRHYPGAQVGRKLLNRFTRRGRLEAQFKRQFPMGCSGPWGDDTPGPWLTFSEARDVMLEASKAFPAVMRPSYSLGWFDWHAGR